MAKSRKPTGSLSAAASTQFFVKELKGENPLSRSTAARLCELSGEFFTRRPWTLIGDEELVLVKPPESNDLCYCSVMGAAGQVFSLHAYIGTEGYRLFKRIASGEPISAGEFFGTQRSVSVELVMAREQTPPDRELLRAVEPAIRRGIPGPIFRAGRPGYHPWYVTEEEGQLLGSCLDAVILFSDHLAAHEDVDYWRGDTAYPLLTGAHGRGHKEQFTLTIGEASDPPAPVIALPAIDTARIDRILTSGFPMHGIVEIDHFYGASMIGGKYDRKACVRGVLVVDAESGFVLQPELGAPSDSIGSLLVRALLTAVESSHHLPREVRVRHGDYATLLRPLASDLRFSLQASEKLPALDETKHQLLQAIGDFGMMSAPIDEDN